MESGSLDVKSRATYSGGTVHISKLLGQGNSDISRKRSRCEYRFGDDLNSQHVVN